MATSAATASSSVVRTVSASAAWKPQLMFAEVMSFSERRIRADAFAEIGVEVNQHGLLSAVA